MSSAKAVKASDQPRYKEAEDILKQAQQGKLLDGKICLTDKSTGKPSMYLKARDLKIQFSDNPQYWKWYPYHGMDVAELLGGCVLSVCGNLDMSRLEVKVWHNVSFIIMMTDDCEGWDTPVSLVLRAGGAPIEQEVVLDDQPRNRGVLLDVGDFVATKTGTVEFSMIDRKCQTARKGMVIMGAVIRPTIPN